MIPAINGMDEKVTYHPYLSTSFDKPSSLMKQESKPIGATMSSDDDWEDVPGESYETIVEFSKC
jgi:hypothetical protein